MNNFFIYNSIVGRTRPGAWARIFLLALLSSVSIAQSNESKPNFIIIFTDDQGYTDVGVFGGEQLQTPNLDQMAAEGLQLTNFYSAAPLCSPSRAALMTGSYPRRIDMAYGSDFMVLLAEDPKGLNPDEVTIAEVLREAGYATGMVGKWHLGDQRAFLPTRHGFDEFFGIPYSHDIHPFHPLQERFNFPPLPLIEGETVIETDPDADQLTARMTERAIQFITEHRSEPFFLYLAHPAPHEPIHVAPAFLDNASDEARAALSEERGTINYQGRRALYPQAIAELDWSVGEVLKTLKSLGLDEQTLVIFTSDNGPVVGSAAPLRGRKGSAFEGGVREPAIVRWPGTLPVGQTNSELMSTMDLLPTLTKLASAQLPDDRVIDGKNVWPVLTQAAKSPHDDFYYFVENTIAAVRSGRWKLHTSDGEPTALYNLDSDIGEQHNVLDEFGQIAAELQRKIDAFEVEMSTNSRPAGWVSDPVPLTQH